ncbi:MAG TPA: cytochrome c [Polyangia bacterium]|nr:cytochrome c [Polyangia bacterium]
MVASPRIAGTVLASGLLALLVQSGCAQSIDVAFTRSPDAGSGTTSTGGQVGTGGQPGTGGARATGGAGGTGGVAGTGGSDGGAPATFTEIYQSILTPMCAGSECHSPGKQAGVSFASQSSAYTSLKSRVVAGDAEASSFYALLNAGVMPPIGNNVSGPQLAEIAAWIDSGATND